MEPPANSILPQQGFSKNGSGQSTEYGYQHNNAQKQASGGNYSEIARKMADEIWMVGLSAQ